MLLFRGALASQKWSKASTSGAALGQKYECADLLPISVTLTSHNAPKTKVQIQRHLQIQIQFQANIQNMILEKYECNMYNVEI